MSKVELSADELIDAGWQLAKKRGYLDKYPDLKAQV